MNHHPNLFFLFKPEAHFVNAMSIYSAVKKLVNDQYYGMSRPKKNTPKKKLKTPFDSCVLPYDLFNRNRMVKLNIK